MPREHTTHFAPCEQATPPAGAKPPADLEERCKLPSDEMHHSMCRYKNKPCPHDDGRLPLYKIPLNVVKVANAATRKAVPIAYAAGYAVGLAANKELLGRVLDDENEARCNGAGGLSEDTIAAIRRARGEQP